MRNGQDMPDMRPEATLIRHRREGRLPPMSLRDAAEAASAAGVKMSESAWRAIESGRYEGRPDKIAIMARVVGITPDELDEVGRTGRENAAAAAGMLRNYLRERAKREPMLAGVDANATSEAVLQLMLEGIDDIRRAEGLTGAQKAALERSLIQSVQQMVAGQLVQIRTTLEIARENARSK